MGSGMVPSIISRAILSILLLAACAPLAWGYAGDTHYYLRFAAALETCFNWDEAHLIASADLMLDKNRSTVAEKHPFKKYNKVNWHAFSRDQERFSELWERVLREQDPELKLIKLGQFSHFLEDWEAHFGWGIRLGHGITTLMVNDPDSLGYSADNNRRMISQSLHHMLQVCAAWGREPESGNDPDRAIVQIYWDFIDLEVMDQLFDSNTPRWKKWGKRWKQGKKILAENHLLVEKIIELRANASPGRDIPADFTPGDPERGIPPPIGMRLEQDGSVTEILGVETELSPEYSGTDMSVEEEEAFEEEEETGLVDDLEAQLQDGRDIDLNANVQLSLQDARLTDGGWLIEVEIENQGNKASQAGRLELVVLDVVSEDLLAESSWGIAAVSAGEKIAREFEVKAGGEPTREVMIGASLEIDDLSADNNDVWFVPWKEEIADLRKEKEKKKRKGKRRPGFIEILGQPEFWIDAEGRTYLALSAFVSGGDSSRRLGRLHLEIGDAELVVEKTEGVWFSVPDLRRRLVPGRGIFYFRREEAICDELEKGARTAKLTIDGKNVASDTMDFELQSAFVAPALDTCARTTPRGD